MAQLAILAIAYSRQQGYRRMILHAQAAAVKFYERLGFKAIGDPFDEAGIAHLKMERELID